MEISNWTAKMWSTLKELNKHFYFLILLFYFTSGGITAQVNTGGSATTNNHSKQVIGYITNWDAWKQASAGLPAQGALTHLNIDYSKYTILNYSFFGVAVDGSLHSGDHRNKNIYQSGAVQQPAELLYSDIYSSWDFHILFGEIDAIQWINEDVKQRAEALGFVVQVGGNTWSHPEWGLSGVLPLPLPKEGGAPGLLELAHQKGVKVMASIGGWSMCKHFPEMAADAAKRARFIEDCKKLINMGFDGIDLDWEYPGPFAGMNFTGSNADFANFATLVQEIRNAIGPDKLITAAMAADPAKLDGFNWSQLASTMDYFNMMTYDFNGGWSNIAGHNAPVYPYDGAEAPDFNWQSTFTKLQSLGVPSYKINFGIPFYGRGVVTNGNAALNAPTTKVNVTIQPDGPISTAADYTNWPLDVYDGTPNYFFIKQKTGSGSGWTRHWDDQAQVPYMTKGNYFLSYDDEESVGIKAQFINNNNLAGTIVWTVYGDLELSGSYESFGTKLKRWSNVSSSLINKVNEVFANGGGGNTPPSVTITSPQTGATFDAGSNISITANASDSDGSITKVEFYNGSTLLGEKTSTPYTFSWNNVSAGSYSIIVKAYDNEGSTSTNSVNITVNGIGGNELPTVSITSPLSGDTFTAGSTITISANASDSDGSISKVEFYNGTTLLGEQATSPYTFNWANVAAGSYTINVKAIDNENGIGTASVSITVNGGGTTSCTAPAWVSGQAYNGGEVVSYEGHEYKAKWWTNQNPAGSTEWEDLGPCDGNDDGGNGTCTAPAWVSGQAYNGGEVVSYEGHEYKAKWWTNQNPVGSSEWEDLGACDDGGGQTGNNPQVSITSPGNGQSFIEGSSVTINASASDNDGSIAKVEFFSNGVKLGETLTSPYSFTISNISIGSYSLTAIATDNDNLTTTSSSVTINVSTDGGCDNSGFKVVGYMPSWQGSATNIQYDKLTHINYSFLLPNSDGSLRSLENAAKLQQIVTLAHQQNVKVLIAVGGWMDGNDSAFTTMAASASTRTNFVNNLVNFVNQYNLDGVDMDWEYPREGSEPQNYELLMQELGQAMHNRGKLLTAAVVVSGWNADGILSGVFDDVDFLNIMAYDGSDHSTYAQAEGGLNYWLNRGLPKEKAVLGVPFYSRPTAISYADLIAQGADPYSDSYQGNNYNGITTIKSKTQLALDRAGGIMMWELSHDTTNEQLSLLNAINEVAGDPCGNNGGEEENSFPVVSITSPAAGSTFNEGDLVSISASASDSDGNITKVEFYSNNVYLGEVTSSPYSFNWNGASAGTYSLTAKAFDNENASATSGGINITVNANDDGGGNEGNCDEPQYVENGGYVAGSTVQNEGNVYQCKDYPYSGWCNGAAWAYAPGTGDYWQDAWTLVGECTGSGDNGSSPSVSITSPSSGQSFQAGNNITMNVNASDSDGEIVNVEFFSNGNKIGEDNSAPYSYTITNAQAGSYSLTAVATDNSNTSSVSSAVNITVSSTDGGGGNEGELADKILVGYWHNFINDAGGMKLSEVSDKWDVINIAFAIPSVLAGSNMTFTPDPAIYSSTQEFKNDVAALQNSGKKVVISMGGETGVVSIDSPEAAQNFSSSMINIITEYGFDGMDIDFEGSSISLAGGDTDFRNPTSPKIVNLISACQTILNHFGSDFILSMAPETLYVQGGYSGYGGPSGAYLPLIYALRNDLDYIHVQHYNTGCMLGLDGLCYGSGNANFHVAMADMLLQGFPAGGQQFPALRPDQVAIGLPASSSAAGSGYTPPAEVQKALDYIIKGQSFGGSYTLRNPSGYPDFRGLMTWSINWDRVNGYEYSNSHRPYLDGVSNASLTTLSARVVEEEKNVSLYPVPVNEGILYLEINPSETSQYYSFSMFDITGLKVFEQSDKLNPFESTPKRIDINKLNQGVYFYKLSLNGKIYEGKVIKR
ncbi:glycosyl hydrolase family 18 protein [Abyssalbus ytuae]|uniref:chitinase n=1 Tax=Abyssalbus ytuae TaxID=2926907 RepID=A0A9E7CTU1_9FLAO|nr:glycosyl hydrolase family 18 protein [Abyssalbus ytuae]UOB16797.1 glycosyl hydrolase family 18 protein [Abyssalbus ytuae]